MTRRASTVSTHGVDHDGRPRMDFASALDALMTERGISAYALARDIPCNRALICKYRNGTRPPSERLAQRCDEVLGAGGQLAALAAQSRPSRRVVSRVANPALPGALTWLEGLAAPQGSLDETGTIGDWNDMERRRLLLAALGVSAGALASSGPLNSLIDLALTSEPRDLGEWQLAVADHLHAIRSRPPAQACDDLLLDLFSLRRQMTAPEAEVTELQRVVAALSILHANALTRLGDHGAALRWCRTARHAADNTGDLDLRLLVRCEEAGYGLYGQRDPATVLRLLDDADRITGGTQSVWRADLMGTRAKALSLLGRHEDARTAVRAFAAAVPDDATSSPIPACWRPDMVDFAESWVCAHAGDEAAADDARSRVLAYRFLDYQYAANVRLHESLCAVANGGVDTGARQAAGILAALPPGQRSQMITETGKTVLRAVPHEQQERPPVREFREVLATTAPGPRVLSTGA